ncbi:MAG TPA: SPOR domain-containing protein [Steroidobacteraceae bacterium]|nr:SPOR domain-containing protein [Steroidobacteraceae bacterium]
MACKNLWRQISILCTVTVLAAVLSGCSREKEDWRSAQAADTAAAYEQFLKEHPASEQAAGATTRLTQLAEEEDWQRAATEDSLQAYQQFLTRHDQGKWAQEARIRIENFAIADPATADPNAPPADSPAAAMADLAKAGTAATPANVAPGPARPPAAKPPAAKPVPAKPVAQQPVAQQPVVQQPGAKPPAPVSASGSPAKAPAAAAVQLGAFSTAAAAESQWQQIAGRYKKELAGLEHRVVTGKVTSGTVHRLQVPMPTEAAARQLCGQLKAAGQACVLGRT